MSAGPTPAQRRMLTERDPYCLHCGTEYGLVPHHRANRGHGGYKAANVPANLLMVCGILNGMMESDPDTADLARDRGWKISRYDSPENTPVYDATKDQWFYLRQDGTKETASYEGTRR